MTQFRRQSRYEVPVEGLFAWHERPGAYDRLAPPWEGHQVVSATGDLATLRAEIRVPWLGPLTTRWIAVHEAYEKNRMFRDRQESGPFARWVHTHTFTPDGPNASRIEDEIDYELPMGGLGTLFGAALVERRLRRAFEYRHVQLGRDLARHARFADQGRRTIAITGATGLVGSALAPFLTTGGHTVVRLGRGTPAAGSRDARWDPATGAIDAGALEGLDAVVHLAGESIAAGRWNDERKARIRRSRTEGTRLLAHSLAGLARKPRVLICASAVGYYGNRETETVDEGSAPGSGFLPDVCREWEAAADPARAAGIRVVHLRFGIILSPRGGALAKMLPPFRMGGGGVIGSGLQGMPWVDLDDVLGAVQHVLFHEDIAGPVNVVGPESLDNAEFTRVLGRVLRRPTFTPLPSFAVRLIFGEMGQALLLEGARVRPAVLERTGFRFHSDTLDAALRMQLGAFDA